tara:strand:- start:87 stop:491 length:405 start_codon:yes stop_codon:yes gene_type:complete
MKIFISSFLFLILVSCGGDAANESASASPQPSYNKDTFFECELDSPEQFGSFASITYDSEANTASFESDYMTEKTPARGIIYPVVDITKTGEELILVIDLGYGIKSRFRLNRSSLKLSGTRDGTCKIVQKDLAF